jgi:hypothetical protein
VTEGFVQGLPFDDSRLLGLVDSDEGTTAKYPDNLHFVQQAIPTYKRLSSRDCKQSYAQLFIRDKGDVVVVVAPKTPETNQSIVYGSSSGGWGAWPYRWLCPRGASQNFDCYTRLQKSNDDWHFPNYESAKVAYEDTPKVQYCLSKPMEQRCKLEYGFMITLLTVIANFLKLIGFVVTWWLLKRITRDTNPQNRGGENDQTLLITTVRNVYVRTACKTYTDFAHLPLGGRARVVPGEPRP